MTAAVDVPDAGPVVRLSRVTRRFGRDAATVVALDRVDLEVAAGELVVLHGRSGAGKSTLLSVVGGLDRPDEGEVSVCGVDLVRAGDAEVARLRRTRVAHVFQSFGLLPLLSAAENVGVPLRLRGVAAADRERRVAELLDRVGLGSRADHRPHELSGGEQQRVAIARALASEPDLLLADEPTAQLDAATAETVLELTRTLHRELGVTVLLATHEPDVLPDADRVIELRDGAVVDGEVPHA